MPYALGDTVTLTITAPADADVALHVTAPDGTESEPATTNVTTTWSGSVTANQLGQWLFTWIVTGSGDDVEIGSFQVGNPWYATLVEAKDYLGITTTNVDAELSDQLALASRDIDKACGRKFWDSDTASARRYYVKLDARGRTWVDDFYTTTGLIIKLDYDGDGTYETTLTSAQYELQPLDGVVDGEEGWPYWMVKLVNTDWPSQTLRAPLQVTAKWGWTNVPAAAKTACIILADEALKLAREAPFGVAGFGADGAAVRIRSNPRVRDILYPYMREPAKAG